MKLNFSTKAARYFRISMLSGAVSGIVIGLITCGAVEGFRSSVLLWILLPLIIGFAISMLILGFYLIFLRK